MPEMKHQFAGGKMNKDLDERMVPNGDYRDALNIEISTSESSDVGTVQNVLGNIGINIGTSSTFELSDLALAIGSVADEKNDTLYWFVWDSSVDYIISYKRGDNNANFVFIDKAKNVLKFSPAKPITGINILDGMLFWTDNNTEPKKINIQRSIDGTNPNGTVSTSLIPVVTGTGSIMEEKYVTVIKKTPPTPMSMELVGTRLPTKTYTGVIKVAINTGSGINTSSFTGSDYNFATLSIGDEFNVSIEEGIDASAQIISLGNIESSSGLTGWQPGASGSGSVQVGQKVVFQAFDDDGLSPPGLPITAFSVMAVIVDAYPLAIPNTFNDAVKFRITNIDGIPPLPVLPATELKYAVDLFEEAENLFEFKFPRFSYRYKYEDGEYSPFAPFTQVAFLPGAFDYHPRKGYNLGMTNILKQVSLSRFINKATPLDVVAVDILFKDESSPTIYIVDTLKPLDSQGTSSSISSNSWNTVLNGGSYLIEKETIKAAVPSNQLLRPWDNVPRKALCQEITGNRIVYGNYVQNYDLKVLGGADNDWSLNLFVDPEIEFGNTITDTSKSIKSLREYQLGVVFTDKYGRETPVISNKTGTTKLTKERADNRNRILTRFENQGPPKDFTHFKFFIKETASEYYNMAMDRWYDADDGNIWLAFPSSDRNKIDIDTFLILKKGADTNALVEEEARYKVLAIENEAPDFIKTSKQTISKRSHSSSNPLFPTGSQPFSSKDNFELNYELYHATSGQSMHLEEDDLYVRFKISGTSQTSDTYKITQFTTNYEGGNTASTDKYSIQLDKPLGSDVDFISNNASGGGTSIQSGAKVEILRYKVENHPKFDGRFFVKIYYDDVFKTNISSGTEPAIEYKVVSSKSLYSLSKAHIDLHTIHPNTGFQKTADRYLVDGENSKFKAGANKASWKARNRGWYQNDAFSSFAQYFRRYEKEYHGGPGNLETVLSTHDQLNSTTASIELDYVSLKNLKIGGNIPYMTGGVTENWKVNPDWIHEYGVPTNDTTTFKAGYTANFLTHDGTEPNPAWFEGHGKNKSTMGGGWEEKSKADYHGRTKETEVWFIDAGPYVATRGNDDMRFGAHSGSIGSAGNMANGYQQSVEKQPWNLGTGPQGDFADYGYEDAGGIFAGNFTMRIGYGGIAGYDINAFTRGGTSSTMDAYDAIGEAADFVNETWPNSGSGYNQGFYNVGDWIGATPTSTVNPNYTHLNNFVGKFIGGERFRFKEDPFATQYSISGVDSSKQRLRHSNRVENIIAKKGGALPAQTANYGTNPNDSKPYENDSMAELLSFNFTKSWRIVATPSLGSNWNPLDPGQILNGLEITLPIIIGPGGNTASNPTSLSDELIIYVDNLEGVSVGGGVNLASITSGMALAKYTADGVLKTVDAHLDVPVAGTNQAASSNKFLVVRHIESVTTGAGVTHFELYLSGYSQPFTTKVEHEMGSDVTKMPEVGGDYVFVQVGMNGYSPNSEFNINTMGAQEATLWGKIGAVGYTLEFLEEVEPEIELSENPAIWETEPKNSEGLDIYYEATGAIPISIEDENIADAFPVGSTIIEPTADFEVIGYAGAPAFAYSGLRVSPGQFPITTFPTTYQVIRPDGLEVNVIVDSVGGSNNQILKINTNMFGSDFKLAWHNCYSFGNGVESNRIRDNFNQPFIANGVKASTVLEQEHKEERRQHGLIYSGIYNSISGTNNTNQFIQAEKITKDINPIYGSIQKLHSRSTADGDLITLCEDRVLKILANKDALFNADGSSNVTSTDNVLGVATPYSGNFGISTNPESFASESYRVYFTDKVRGAVMRLSKDGLTPISNVGMKDWFRDNLRIGNRLIGSYDDRNSEYNLSISNNEANEFPCKILGLQKGPGQPWVPTLVVFVTPLAAQSIQVGDVIAGPGFQANSIIATKQNMGGGFYPFNYRLGISAVPGVIMTPNVSQLGGYSSFSLGFNWVAWDSFVYITHENKEADLTLTFSEQVKGWSSFKSFKPENARSMANDYYTFLRGNIFKHYDETVSRNNFYGDDYDSSVSVLLNKQPGSVKEFNTINYEGSQSRIQNFENVVLTSTNLPYQPTTNYNDQQYYNLQSKDGWYVDSIETDQENGYIDELLDKEGKWFNYIKRNINLELTRADTGDFSFQGIAFPNVVSDDGVAGSDIQGCMDPLAPNYDPTATVDDGTCTTGPSGANFKIANQPKNNNDPATTVDDDAAVAPQTNQPKNNNDNTYI